MIKYCKNIIAGLITWVVLFPLYLHAQPSQGTGQGSQGTGQASQGVSPGVGLTNPLGNKDLMTFLQDILDVIMVFAVPLIVFMIIYAGFLFVMDRGSEKNLAQAKRALLYAVIGGVIILGAQAILAVVQGTVDAFRT